MSRVELSASVVCVRPPRLAIHASRSRYLYSLYAAMESFLSLFFCFREDPYISLSFSLFLFFSSCVTPMPPLFPSLRVHPFICFSFICCGKPRRLITNQGSLFPSYSLRCRLRILPLLNSLLSPFLSPFLFFCVLYFLICFT